MQKTRRALERQFGHKGCSCTYSTTTGGALTTGVVTNTPLPQLPQASFGKREQFPNSRAFGRHERHGFPDAQRALERRIRPRTPPPQKVHRPCAVMTSGGDSSGRGGHNSTSSSASAGFIWQTRAVPQTLESLGDMNGLDFRNFNDFLNDLQLGVLHLRNLHVRSQTHGGSSALGRILCHRCCATQSITGADVAGELYLGTGSGATDLRTGAGAACHCWGWSKVLDHWRRR